MAHRIRFYSHTLGDHAAFSNFSKHGFSLDGYMWFTNEHFYQANKFVPGGERFMAIKDSATPREAKRLGSLRVGDTDPSGKAMVEAIDPTWEDGKKLVVMRRGLRAKFSQNPELIDLLVDTADAELIENAPGDRYWGCGTDDTGSNWLGRLLMELRTELRK